jgi:uncharacterized protein YbjT (DUF2867 family)
VKVLVIGATGNLGREVVSAALDAGHAVTALVRRPEAITVRSDSLQVVQGDARDSASLDRAVAGHDAVVSCLGTADRRDSTLRTEGVRNTIAAMRAHGVRRLIVFSAFGAGDSAPDLRRASFMFGRVIQPLLLKAPFADMTSMEDDVRASGLDWTIVRPTALTKKPATHAVTAVVDGADGLGGSIPYADVAQFMVDQLTTDRYVGKAPAISAARRLRSQ